MQIERAFDNRLKQQDGEKEVVDKAFNLLPDGAVKGGMTADEVAADDQKEIREEELRVIHQMRITVNLPWLGFALMHIPQAVRAGPALT